MPLANISISDELFDAPSHPLPIEGGFYPVRSSWVPHGCCHGIFQWYLQWEKNFWPNILSLKNKTSSCSFHGPTTSSSFINCWRDGLFLVSSLIASTQWGRGLEIAHVSSISISSLRERASTTVFSLPCLYSTTKSNPISLYNHCCWAAVVMVWRP